MFVQQHLRRRKRSEIFHFNETGGGRGGWEEGGIVSDQIWSDLSVNQSPHYTHNYQNHQE